MPRLGCVNSHPSLLPRYRGPSPIAWQVRNGEQELGVTYHRMDEQFDTGGVLAQATLPVGDDDWMPDLLPRFAALTPELLTRVFERVAAGDPGDPQDDAEASYAGFFDDEYGELDWAWPADELHRRVRAWSFQFGWGRGARVELDGEPVRLVRTRVEPGTFDGRPGEVLRRDGEAVLVRCGEDALWVLESEPAAEAGLQSQSFLDGRSLPQRLRVEDGVRVEPLDLRLALRADLLDRASEALLHEAVELLRRLPHVDDVDAAVAEVRDVEDRAVRVLALPLRDRPHRVVLLARDAVPPHLHDTCHASLLVRGRRIFVA